VLVCCNIVRIIGGVPQTLCFVGNTYMRPIPVSARYKMWCAAARLLGLQVRIPPGSWMSVFCECCVLPGRGLCDGPIPGPENSYRLWCVWVRSGARICLCTTM